MQRGRRPRPANQVVYGPGATAGACGGRRAGILEVADVRG